MSVQQITLEEFVAIIAAADGRVHRNPPPGTALLVCCIARKTTARRNPILSGPSKGAGLCQVKSIFGELEAKSGDSTTTSRKVRKNRAVMAAREGSGCSHCHEGA